MSALPGGVERHEHHVSVSRTARYWTLADPSVRTREVWFVLHGYGQLARRFLRRFEPVAMTGRLIVAPEALSRFYVSQEPGRHGPESVVGATWMTREDRETEIRDYVRYLDVLADTLRTSMATGRPAGAAGPPFTALGFSQGVATASRWAVLGEVRPSRLILWGDTLPPDLDMERAARALEGVEVVLVRGSRDRAVEDGRAAEERRRLEEAGLSWRVVAYEGGHDVEPEVLAELARAAPGAGD